MGNSLDDELETSDLDLDNSPITLEDAALEALFTMGIEGPYIKTDDILTCFTTEETRNRVDYSLWNKFMMSPSFQKKGYLTEDEEFIECDKRIPDGEDALLPLNYAAALFVDLLHSGETFYCLEEEITYDRLKSFVKVHNQEVQLANIYKPESDEIDEILPPVAQAPIDEELYLNMRGAGDTQEITVKYRSHGRTTNRTIEVYRRGRQQYQLTDGEQQNPLEQADALFTIKLKEE